MRMGCEVVALVEIVDESGMGGLPAQHLPGQGAAGWAVDREVAGEPGEVLGRVLGRDGDHGEVEMPAYDLGDGADRYAFVGDRVQGGSRCGPLQREAVQVRGVKAVYGGPAVG